jgi:putative ABC transport system substrate-binding protein
VTFPSRLGVSAWTFIALALTVAGLQYSHSAESGEKVVRLGFVDPHSPSSGLRGVDAFWQRLRELGWVEGKNLTVERRWAENRIDQLPAVMAEVIGRKVDVLVTYSTPAALAAKKATRTVPIVSAVMGDPVGTGEAQSLARPGENLTGLSLGWGQGIGGKWLELLQEMVPRLSRVAVLSNPDNPVSVSLAKELEAMAPTLRLRVRVLEARARNAFGAAISQAHREAQAMIVLPDPVSVGHRQEVAALAARYRVPTVYWAAEYVYSGGLIAYGVDHGRLFRRAADYVDKILKGANPAELPIEQPTQYVLVVNMKAARALGLTMPESILLRADEVIR